MILSVWRYCHLSLALISSVFLITLSVTGIILSFYPINDKLSNLQTHGLDKISVASFIKKLESHNNEIFEINVLKNGFLTVNAMDSKGKTSKFYANPVNGQNLGSIKKESSLLTLSRNIHRSLLLKKNGRIIIGVVSFLLFLIAISGSFLVIKKQLSIKKFYSKVIYDDFNKFWHLLSGRTFVFFIIIISLSGTVMSLDRFEIIKNDNSLFHSIDYNEINNENTIPCYEFKIFKKLMLSQIEKIEFPFSSFKEDHFTVKLKSKEIIINQFNGSVLSSIDFGFTQKILNINYNLHTGNGSIIWSIVLGISCVAILFFIYSGIRITISRKKHIKRNKHNSDESNYVILVGSENGNTNKFAKHIYDTIERNNKKVFIDQLNNYKPTENLKQLIIVTSTYGLGQPPSNAKKFIKKYKKSPLKLPFEYCVVGFGSRSYPDFCQYALDVEKLFGNYDIGKNIIPTHLINNQSKTEYREWYNEWSVYNNFSTIETETDEMHDFQILKKTQSKKDPNLNFKIELKPIQKLTYNSGDIIAIKPPESDEERYYSIGKISENKILLSLKKHQQGLCSSYLDKLKAKEKFSARIIKNTSFNLPEKYKNILLISNGTGIAPLLGMAYENNERKNIQMYWGVKHSDTLKLYRNCINELIDDDKLAEFNEVYSESKKHKKMYVQDLMEVNKNKIKNQINDESYFMICGSKEMGNDVLKKLGEILGQSQFEQLLENEQILIDTY